MKLSSSLGLMAMGYNRRSKSRKTAIGSKELAKDIIYNKGGYLAVVFNKLKEKKCLNHIA